MNEKVEIFRAETKTYKAEEDVYYQDDWIIFDGWHAGSAVKRVWGDADLEYFVKIPPESIPILKRKLWVWWMKPDQFLRYLARKFEPDTMFQDVRDYLDKHNIKYEIFMWV